MLKLTVSKLYWKLHYKIFKPITRTDILIKQCRLKGVSYNSLTLGVVSPGEVGESDWHQVYVKALRSKLDG